MKQSLSVGDEDAFGKRRLDQFLLKQLPHCSRSQIQKWIVNGYVTVNDRVFAKHYLVKVHDRVAIDVPEEKTVTSQRRCNIPILSEDDALFIINKPHGVLAHAVNERGEWTVADFLRLRYPRIDEVGERGRAGIVHRLDRDVSGVMVIAKTQESYHALKNQFALRKVTKEYRAIVHGVPSQPVGVITFKIARSRTHAKMAARPRHEEGKEAVTEYEVLKTFNHRYAYVAIITRTGRTHQIRAHLAAIGHPIVGDTIYTSRRYRSRKPYPRLFLHALELKLQHPATLKWVQWEAPLPQEFEKFLAVS